MAIAKQDEQALSVFLPTFAVDIDIHVLVNKCQTLSYIWLFNIILIGQ